MLANITVSFFIVFILIFLGIALITVLGRYFSLWFQSFVSGAPISLFNIAGIAMRKIPPRLIVNTRINLCKAGLKNITVADLETHYLAGGHLNEVMHALIAADKANIDLDWRRATAIDLAGRDLFEAIRTSVNPKVIDCPPNASEGGYISAVAKDGIELRCRARVTVRTNIHQLVGGATEETVIARIGEAIVSAIGSSDTHSQVLEFPERISKAALSKGLDKQTAFEIISIDISEISIGENVGARLRIRDAEAGMKVAESEAAKRKAVAEAKEKENKAEVVKAEIQVPLAMAEAFRLGHLGIMDFKRIRNLEADTDMRSAIAKETSDANV